MLASRGALLSRARETLTTTAALLKLNADAWACRRAWPRGQRARMRYGPSARNILLQLTAKPSRQLRSCLRMGQRGCFGPLSELTDRRPSDLD